MMIFKLMVGINVVLYALVRSGDSIFSRWLTNSVFYLFLVLFVFLSFRLGNRTDLLAFFLGVAVFESYKIKFNAKVIAKALMVCAFCFVVLSVLEAFRYKDDGSDTKSHPYRDWETDRKSTRLNSSHSAKSRMPSSA